MLLGYCLNGTEIISAAFVIAGIIFAFTFHMHRIIIIIIINYFWKICNTTKQ
jgi:hypothetical protein